MALTCLFGHRWDGCRCQRCGSTRDEGHDMKRVLGKLEEKCIVCDKTRAVKPQPRTCTVCGKTGLKYPMEADCNLDIMARECPRCWSQVCVFCLKELPHKGTANLCPACSKYGTFEVTGHSAASKEGSKRAAEEKYGP